MRSASSSNSGAGGLWLVRMALQPMSWRIAANSADPTAKLPVYPSQERVATMPYRWRRFGVYNRRFSSGTEGSTEPLADGAVGPSGAAGGETGQ